jgi:hypothetical protein
MKMHANEDFREGVLRVLVRHTDAAPNDDHDKLHRLGKDDRAELHILDLRHLNLPRHVSRPHTGRFYDTVEVSMSDDDVLTIREHEPYTPQQRYSDGNSSTGWFDILVGFGLATRRLEVARHACQMASQNNTVFTHSLDVKIPLCVVDGIADRLRGYFDTSDRGPGW